MPLQALGYAGFGSSSLDDWRPIRRSTPAIRFPVSARVRQALDTPWLTVENIDAVMPFYVDVLGFGLSNYMQNPFRAYFLHINARHHSLALIGTGRNGMHHLIVEPFWLDDIGQSYDVVFGRNASCGLPDELTPDAS